jgi:hypothetical protein
VNVFLTELKKQLHFVKDHKILSESGFEVLHEALERKRIILKVIRQKTPISKLDTFINLFVCKDLEYPAISQS